MGDICVNHVNAEGRHHHQQNAVRHSEIRHVTIVF